MDSSLAIVANNLSKKYRLGTIGMSSLREDIYQWWHKDKVKPYNNKEKNSSYISKTSMINKTEFWALENLNFNIPTGQVVGLIGSNGSGKSTLLKILSRITEPTSGEVKIRGKVVSLLEVGTGFHPELTGRENVYINGAILGINRRDVNERIDEIIDFAGVNEFIDTPIKRYSSGMTVRLGFSIAAHLNPDIMIIDEVLAVGDATFQQKCLGKMQDISREGRTIIFVSHQLHMIEKMCSTTMLLSDGRIKSTGKTKNIVKEYLEEIYPSSCKQILIKRKHREGSGFIKFSEISLKCTNGQKIDYVKTGDTFFLNIKFNSFSNDFKNLNTDGACVLLNIDNSSKQAIGAMSTLAIDYKINYTKIVRDGLKLKINRLALMPGEYFITAFLGNSDNAIDWIRNAYKLTVIDRACSKVDKKSLNGHGNLVLDYTFM